MLKIELTRFEVEDIITASAEIVPETTEEIVEEVWDGTHENYCRGVHPQSGPGYFCNCDCHLFD